MSFYRLASLLYSYLFSLNFGHFFHILSILNSSWTLISLWFRSRIILFICRFIIHKHLFFVFIGTHLTVFLYWKYFFVRRYSVFWLIRNISLFWILFITLELLNFFVFRFFRRNIFHSIFFFGVKSILSCLWTIFLTDCSMKRYFLVILTHWSLLGLVAFVAFIALSWFSVRYLFIITYYTLISRDKILNWLFFLSKIYF